MLLDEFVRKMEEKTGIAPLKFSEEGVISLGFTRDSAQYEASIEKTEDDAEITLYAKVGALPQRNREACMKSMLQANLFTYDLNGATLGIDKITDEIYLSRVFTLESTDFDAFYKAFENFLEVEVTWIKRLNDNLLKEE